MNKFYNSHKGEIFLRKFVQEFEYNDIDHQYGGGEMKNTLLKKQMIGNLENIHLLYQAKNGDLKEIRRSVAIGRNINFRDYDNRTALHLAACHGHFDVVRYLVNHGAAINVEDRFGNTPVEEAKNNGHTEIQQFLEENA
jgi:ankyrin repeat protein